MEARKEWLEEDYYAELGVSSDATADEITKEYRKLAREFHPDANPDNSQAEERFKKVSAAYDVLEDAEKRKQYDEVRRYGARMGPGGAGGPGGMNYSFDFEGGDINDLLGGLFGGGGQSPFGHPGGPGAQMPRRGMDQEATLAISFAEAIEGMTTNLTLSDGSGQRDIKVRIPAGVSDGQVLRLAGKGSAGHGGAPKGDLLITLSVGPDDVFERDGKNLTIEVPITFAQAALGATISVPTFGGGSVGLKIPAGTASGRKFRVKGKGVQTKKATGNLLVTVTVAVPQHLTESQKRALETYAEMVGEPPRTSDVSADPKLGK